MRALVLLALTVSGSAVAQDGAAADAPLVEFEPVEELQNYVAVSTKVTQPAITTPASVSVITQEQIARAGYRSVAEALATVPGFYVSYDLVNYHVAVRGALGGARAGSRLLKVMIDGVPVPFAQSETYFLGPEFVPMSAIDRIEVLRGPASSLYGAGAYAGAINIVTRQDPYEGDTTIGGEIRGYYGIDGVDGPGADAVVSVTSRGTSLLLGGAGALEDRSGLSVPDDSPFAVDYAGQQSEDTARPAVAFVKAVQGIGPGRLSVIGITQVHQRDAEFYDVSVLSNDTKTSLVNWKLSGAYEAPFGTGFTSTVRASVSGGQSTRSDRLQLPGEPFYYERELSYFSSGGAIEMRYDFPSLAFLLVGVDGYGDVESLPRFYEVQGNQEPNPVNQEQSETLANGAAYLQAVAPVSAGFGVAAGGRVDMHSVFGPQANGRAALNFDYNNRVAVKLIGGTSFKAASPQQLYTTANPIPLEIEGNADLTPQRLLGAEAVIEGYPTSTVLVSTSVFANQYRDTIGYLQEGGELIPTAYDAQNVGGEAGLRVHQPIADTSFVEGAVSLSLQQTVTEENPDAVFEDKQFPDNEGVPVVMTYTRVGVSVAPARVNVAAEYRYIGDRVPSQSNLLENNNLLMSQPNYTLGDYHMLDLTVSSTPIEVSDGVAVRGLAKVQNALDEAYLEVGFNGVDVPSIGRTFWLRFDVLL